MYVSLCMCVPEFSLGKYWLMKKDIIYTETLLPKVHNCFFNSFIMLQIIFTKVLLSLDLNILIKYN